MKKLMIVPVLALGMLFTTNVAAQEARVAEKESAMLTVEKVEPQDQQLEPQDQQQRDQKKNFTRIETNQLPQAVRNAVTRDHEGTTINEAHISEDRSTYKLVVSVGNERKTLYSDANGNLKKEKEE
jgi:hypothetical protein